MLQKHYIFFSLLFIMFGAAAQDSDVVWQRTFGGQGDDVVSTVITDDQGNIYITGTTQKGFFHNLFIQCLDQNGTVLWKQEIDGDKDDKSVYMTIDSNGELLLLASSSSQNNSSVANYGNFDIVLYRFDLQGQLLDSDHYGGTQIDLASHITELPNGNYLISGSTRSKDVNVKEHFGQYDIWVCEVDYSGAILWEKSFGGEDEDFAVQTLPLSDGSYMICAQSNSIDQFTDNRGDLDATLIKIDQFGTVVWQNSYGGFYDEVIKEIIELPNGHIIGTTTTHSNGYDISKNHGGTDIWVFEIDASGNLIWEQSYGSYGDEYAAGIQAWGNGFMLLGTTSSDYILDAANHGAQDFCLYYINEAREIEHHQLFGDAGFDQSHAFRLQNDGSVLLAGATNSTSGIVSDNNGQLDGWILKVQSGFNAASPQTSVHPNPTADVIYVNRLESFSNITLVDINGQLLYSTETSSELATIVDLSLYPSGVYVLNIASDRGIETHRLVKY